MITPATSNTEIHYEIERNAAGVYNVRAVSAGRRTFVSCHQAEVLAVRVTVYLHASIETPLLYNGWYITGPGARASKAIGWAMYCDGMPRPDMDTDGCDALRGWMDACEADADASIPVTAAQPAVYFHGFYR